MYSGPLANLTKTKLNCRLFYLWLAGVAALIGGVRRQTHS